LLALLGGVRSRKPIQPLLSLIDVTFKTLLRASTIGWVFYAHDAGAVLV